MKLSEAKYILEDAGYIIEDTDEYDDADLGLNVKPKEYHKQKAKMASLKNRVIQAYEEFIRRKEKDAEQSWKKNVKYRGGGNDEDDLMEEYEKRWGEKFQHQNTMTLYEFYKIMMSNYSTRSFIKNNSKDKDLEGCLASKNSYWDNDDDDDDYNFFQKPSSSLLYVQSVCCKNAAAKKLYQKELIEILNKSKTPELFCYKCDNLRDHYDTLFYKLDDKIDDLEDNDKLVPKELKEKHIIAELLKDALWDWSNEWLEEMAQNCGDIPTLKKMISYLFKNNFSTEAGIEVYNKLTKKPEPKNGAKKTEEKVPPIVKVMYKTFMNKMKTKLIYRAVEVDVDWVDDQLDDMEDKWHQEDKAEYLRKNKYKERMGLANVNLHAVGNSWCWNDDTSAISGNGGDEYMIVAENDPSNIDLTMSALCAAEWSQFGNKGTKLTGEEEVRVLNELNVTVLDVYTGSGKQRTHLDRRDTYYRDEH